MKRAFFLTLCIIFSVLTSYATEASKYAAKQYSEENENKKVKITVKKEHTEEYHQKIGEWQIPAITYGYGDMKVKGKRKARISYICLRDAENNIVWSCIIPR